MILSRFIGKYCSTRLIGFESPSCAIHIYRYTCVRPYAYDRVDMPSSWRLGFLSPLAIIGPRWHTSRFLCPIVELISMANLMDEKEKCQIGQDGHDRLSHPNHLVTPGNMANRSQRKTLFLFLLGFSLWLFFRRGPYEISTQLSPVETDRNISWVHSIHDEKASANRSALVPLEAHIMSKCPDAKDCLRDLVVPAMENIVDMVDFNLSFIGM